MLANHTQRQAQRLSPFPWSQRQQSVPIAARCRRGRSSVEVYRRPSATPLLPGRHDLFHFVARVGADSAHDFFEDLYPVPYLAQP